MRFIRITVRGPALAAEQVRRMQQGTTDLMVAVMRKPVEGVAVEHYTMSGSKSRSGMAADEVCDFARPDTRAWNFILGGRNRA